MQSFPNIKISAAFKDKHPIKTLALGKVVVHEWLPFSQKKAMNNKVQDENTRKVHATGEDVSKSCIWHVSLSFSGGLQSDKDKACLPHVRRMAVLPLPMVFSRRASHFCAF